MALNNRIKLNRGVTLVEMMVVVGVLSVMVMVGPSLLRDLTRFSRLNTARIETVRDARDGLGQINKMLRQGQSDSIVVSQESGQPPYSSISFTTVDGRNVKYYQEDNKLQFVVANGTRTISQNLRFLAFAYPRTDDDDIVSVSVTLEKATYEGQTKALQMAIEKVRVMN